MDCSAKNLTLLEGGVTVYLVSKMISSSEQDCMGLVPRAEDGQVTKAALLALASLVFVTPFCLAEAAIRFTLLAILAAIMWVVSMLNPSNNCVNMAIKIKDIWLQSSFNCLMISVALPVMFMTQALPPKEAAPIPQ